MVKNLPAMWKTWIRSLGWEDPLKKGMATHFSILAWRIPMDRGSWKELMLSNCGAGEDSRESLGQQGDETNES